MSASSAIAPTTSFKRAVSVAFEPLPPLILPNNSAADLPAISPCRQPALMPSFRSCMQFVAVLSMARARWVTHLHACGSHNSQGRTATTQTQATAGSAGPIESTGFCNGACCSGKCQPDYTTDVTYCCATASLPLLILHTCRADHSGSRCDRGS